MHRQTLLIAALFLLVATALAACSSAPAATSTTTGDADGAGETAKITRSIGEFISTGEMHDDRFYHNLVTLPDGRVMAIGGRGKGQGGGGDWPSVYDTTEIYDPATGEWTRMGSLVEGRRQMVVAALPDGSVLVAGGVGLTLDPFLTAELWDPATDTWTLTGSLSVARESEAWAVLDDGRVLVTGGLDIELFRTLDSTEIYDPATGEWAEAASMSEKRITC